MPQIGWLIHNRKVVSTVWSLGSPWKSASTYVSWGPGSDVPEASCILV